MEFVAVRDAARQLGVSTRQVQHLAATGELHLVARGLIDRTSLERHLAMRQGSRRRAWSEATAWGAIAMLSGREADWIGESQWSRLRGGLRKVSAEELVSRARNRAQVHHYDGHSSAADHLRRELVDSAAVASSLGLAAAERVDGYVATEDLDRIVARHALVEAGDGRYTLRATTMDMCVVANLADTSRLLAALDLAESLEVRERKVGLAAVEDALRRLRG